MRVEAFAVHFVLYTICKVNCSVNAKTRLFMFVTYVYCFVSISLTYITKPFQHTSLSKSYKLSEYRIWRLNGYAFFTLIP